MTLSCQLSNTKEIRKRMNNVNKCTKNAFSFHSGISFSCGEAHYGFIKLDDSFACFTASSFRHGKYKYCCLCIKTFFITFLLTLSIQRNNETETLLARAVLDNNRKIRLVRCSQKTAHKKP
jgi:hypothetical protein